MTQEALQETPETQETPEEQVARLLQELQAIDPTEAGNLKREHAALEKEISDLTDRMVKQKGNMPALMSLSKAMAPLAGRHDAFPGKIQGVIKDINQIKVDRANQVLARALHEVYTDPDVMAALKDVHGDLKNAHSAFDYEQDKVVRVGCNATAPVRAPRQAKATGGGQDSPRVVWQAYKDEGNPLHKSLIGRNTIVEVDGVKMTPNDLNTQHGRSEVHSSAGWGRGDRNLPHWTADTVYHLNEAGHKVTLHNEG